MNHTEIAKELFDSIPLTKFILDKYQYSWVYGGFMRWLVTYIEDNQEAPSVEETEKELTRRDMDIRIRSNSDTQKFHTRKIVKEIYDKVMELNGYIEFMGHAYKESFRFEHTKPIDLSKEYVHVSDRNVYLSGLPNKNNYFGNYSIWLPTSEEGVYTHYDVSIFNEAGIGYMSDFTVNNIQYNPRKGMVYNEHETIEVVLPDIRNRVMDSCYLDAKKIYRGQKLWKQGYSFSTELTQKHIVVGKEYLISIGTEICSKILQYKNRDWEPFYIYENNTRTPSVLDKVDNIIPNTQHQPTKITKEIFLGNKFIQYVLKTYSTQKHKQAQELIDQMKRWTDVQYECIYNLVLSHHNYEGNVSDLYLTMNMVWDNKDVIVTEDSVKTNDCEIKLDSNCTEWGVQRALFKLK